MDIDMMKCSKCGVELPVFNGKGQHNFCPSSEAVKGRIVEICMKCKMEEVLARWHDKSFPKTKDS